MNPHGSLFLGATFLLGPALALAQTPSAAPKPQPPKPKPAAARSAAPVKPSAVKPKPAPPAEPAVLTVGVERITRSQLETLIASLPDRVRSQYESQQGKRQFANQLAEILAMAQEARRLKLDEEPKTRAQLKLQADQALAQALIQQISARPIDDLTLRQYYEAHQKEYEQVSGRHILIRFKGSAVPIKAGKKDLTEEEALAKAQSLRKRIIDGEDFGTLARQESDDAGSGAAGGTLGSFGRGQMVKAFEDAAFSLPIGEISGPVKTQFGYHLIQVQEQKNSFEAARPLIEQRRKPELTRQASEELKKRLGVTFDESYFGKP